MLDFFPAAISCLQQFGTGACHFAWYVPIFSHAHLPFCTVFATCVPLQALILHGICCMLIVQTFMWVSLESLGCHLGSLEGIFSASFGVSLGFHLRFL